MSAARMGATKWADVAEDSEEDDFKAAKGGSTGNFRTNPDKDGNFMEIQYAERDGKTYKVIKRMKQTITSSWTNDNIQARKDLKKFGKAASNDPASEKHLVVRSEEDIPIEFSRKLAAQAAVKDEAEDKFYEDSLNIAENMNQPKKAWTEANRLKQIDRDEGGAERPAEPDKPSELRDLGASMKAGDAPKSTYVPPSLRGRTGEDPKGKGKDNFAQQQEASLRITNISEDCREGDLQDLFGQVGRLQRVYLAKDQTTGLSRGFAFVTYYTREDAQKAINKLHGHGYDNLILQVQFAKPRV
uniref:Eukaryotic translation initiation factor 3 subunit G n=1 Tax=Zooxanthella nutricula TaxID=1333877 RepID=A0A7S2JDD7_9DINO|mmetsp:Transcript_29304/g.88665  ORF Transcript_29304/g.88665 Transcript_29304/m.88665 type:complete len:300 (+) Transcript_29304:78-977(+)